MDLWSRERNSALRTACTRVGFLSAYSIKNLFRENFIWGVGDYCYLQSGKAKMFLAVECLISHENEEIDSV